MDQRESPHSPLTQSTIAGAVAAPNSHTSLARAKANLQYLYNPKAGPKPTHFRTRAFLRSFRYILVFAFWRLVRYAKYAAVGALIAAVSGTAVGSVLSGAAFFVAPTGLLGGACVGLLWAVGKFGWRRAKGRLDNGRDDKVNPRKDEEEDAEGLKNETTVKPPTADPW